MDAFDHQEVTSDYGSDFTPDEEEILNRLLLRGPEPDNPNTDPDLLFKDIEDNEGPRGAILPRRLGREQWSSQGHPMQNSQAPPQHKFAKVPIQFDNDVPAKSMSHFIQSTSTY